MRALICGLVLVSAALAWADCQLPGGIEAGKRYDILLTGQPLPQTVTIGSVKDCWLQGTTDGKPIWMHVGSIASIAEPPALEPPKPRSELRWRK